MSQKKTRKKSPVKAPETAMDIDDADKGDQSSNVVQPSVSGRFNPEGKSLTFNLFSQVY